MELIKSFIEKNDPLVPPESCLDPTRPAIETEKTMMIFVDLMLIAFIFQKNLSFLYFDKKQMIQIHEVEIL